MTGRGRGPTVRGWLVMALAVAACGSGGGVPTTGAGVDPGGALYATNCSACHGALGEGSTSGPALTDERYHPDVFPDAAFVAAVELGVDGSQPGFGPMPAIPGLDHSEIAAITRFVRSLQSG